MWIFATISAKCSSRIKRSAFSPCGLAKRLIPIWLLKSLHVRTLYRQCTCKITSIKYFFINQFWLHLLFIVTMNVQLFKQSHQQRLYVKTKAFNLNKQSKVTIQIRLIKITIVSGFLHVSWNNFVAHLQKIQTESQLKMSLQRRIGLQNFHEYFRWTPSSDL